MPHDELLADRVRALLKRRRGIEQRNMFGGVAFLCNGHMACGVAGNRLVVRLGDDGATDALREKHTAPMDFTGRPLKSMIYVLQQGTRSDEALRAWVERGLAFARTLPPKA